MKKKYFVSACLMVVLGIGFVIFALRHPEMSFPWDNRITNCLYGLYVDAVVLLFALSFWKKASAIQWVTLILLLAAVFFLVQSVLAIIPEGKPNWYLPAALALNCIALLINRITQKNKQGKASYEAS